MSLIETPRTRLRRLRASDLQNMAELEGNPEIMRHTPSRLPHSLEKVEARLQLQLEKDVVQAPAGVWAVELKDSSLFIGWFMLLVGRQEFPELGFMISQNYWGQGFATEVAAAVIQFGFLDLNFSKIVAVTDPDNLGSKKVLSKLGFVYAKTVSSFDNVLNQPIELDHFEITKT